MPQAKKAQRYCLEELPEDHPLELLKRRRIIGEKVMLSEVFLKKGCDVPSHQHENEQLVVILGGKLRFVLADGEKGAERELTLRGGEVLHLPPNVPHGARALEESHVLDIFSPPSEKTGVDRD